MTIAAAFFLGLVLGAGAGLAGAGFIQHNPGNRRRRIDDVPEPIEHIVITAPDFYDIHS